MLMNRVACGYQSRISALFLSPCLAAACSAIVDQSGTVDLPTSWAALANAFYFRRTSLHRFDRTRILGQPRRCCGAGRARDIARLDESFTVRVDERHGIALRYPFNRRHAFYPDVGDSSPTRGTIGISYTLLGHERFGAVDWR
jgi:hypothetical protein